LTGAIDATDSLKVHRRGDSHYNGDGRLHVTAIGLRETTKWKEN